MQNHFRQDIYLNVTLSSWAHTRTRWQMREVEFYRLFLKKKCNSTGRQGLDCVTFALNRTQIKEFADLYLKCHVVRVYVYMIPIFHPNPIVRSKVSMMAKRATPL